MRVILRDDVVGVGDIGETVKVRAGFARNFLIPRGLAMEADTVSAKQISHRMRQIDAKKVLLRSSAEGEASKMAKAAIQLGLRVGSGGKVFGSIGTRDIAEKLKGVGFEIDRRRVLLSESIKKPGSYFVDVKLHPEVKVQVRVDVEAIAATKQEEEKEAEEARISIEKEASEKAEDETPETEANQSDPSVAAADESAEDTVDAASQEETSDE